MGFGSRQSWLQVKVAWIKLRPCASAIPNKSAIVESPDVQKQPTPLSFPHIRAPRNLDFKAQSVAGNRSARTERRGAEQKRAQGANCEMDSRKVPERHNAITKVKENQSSWTLRKPHRSHNGTAPIRCNGWPNSHRHLPLRGQNTREPQETPFFRFCLCFLLDNSSDRRSFTNSLGILRLACTLSEQEMEAMQIEE
ncbi:hypothetical protein HNY73_023159 [Argiope bruennichi]|uniref:Uncharacterized protein n=1 Tax=Argiope bruennichi TaxID=94029 RepID=A0A8T0E5P2_ARGBR|nr:hypothetical protein HNY73_023159 [Argiope bruennichi]